MGLKISLEAQDEKIRLRDCGAVLMAEAVTGLVSDRPAPATMQRAIESRLKGAWLHEPVHPLRGVGRGAR
jgi:hypothetical protein